MKGITKYKGKLYKRAKRLGIHKGSLIKLVCKAGSEYYTYNGVYEVMDEPYPLSDGRTSGGSIRIPKELTGRKYDLGLKLGYNIFSDQYYQLVEYVRPNKPVPEFQEEVEC